MKKLLSMCAIASLCASPIFAKDTQISSDEIFLQTTSAQTKCNLNFLKKIRFQGNERVLDLGCLDGKLTAFIAHVVPQGYVLGIDDSQAAIEAASLAYPPGSVPNLRFLKRSDKNVNLDKNFDVVVSYMRFHPDQLGFLKNVERAMKEDGTAYYLLSGAQQSEKSLQSAIEKVKKKKNWSRLATLKSMQTALPTEEEFRKNATDANLFVLKAETSRSETVFINKTAFKKWIASWLPVQGVPDSQKQTFLNEVVDEYIKLNPIEKDGLIRHSDLLIEAILKKAK